MLDYKFDNSSSYLVAGTFGSDSMALIDMMIKEGVKPIVCSINYHKFEGSDSDFASLKSYCEKNGLIFEGFDTDSLPEEEKYHQGDFKEWARKLRYGFFKKIYDKYNASALFVAHQQDDLIETYLLQKQRKRRLAHYGLSPISTVNSMVVVRPLLNYSKSDLQEYDEENHVPFSASTSKMEDEHMKNSIRKDVISKMSEIDRENVLDEMRLANDETIGLQRSINHTIEEGEELDIRALIALPEDGFVSAITKLVSSAPEKISLKAKDFSAIRAFCLAPQPNLSMKLNGSTYLIKEYDVITIGHHPDELPYSYVLEKPGKLDTPYFELDFSMGAEDRNITSDDYPITIRSVLPGDNYVVHGYLEPVRRLYSIWKMPIQIRYTWPVFINKDGKIIYVPRFRLVFRECHTSILKMKTTIQDKNDAM